MPEAKPSADDQASAAGIEPPLSTRSGALNPYNHDALLQMRILQALKSCAGAAASNVSVVVRNRSATLFGSAADETQRLALQKLASEVSGIIEVNNRIRLATT